jgi:single-strand selective monofunctional uracil DNA glycosylase
VGDAVTARDVASANAPQLVAIAERLRKDVAKLQFAAPITHVYNPLDYARAPHREYLERYGRGRHEVVLVGMNPGPFGMAQTGVPFGDAGMVRDWLKIDAPVRRPRAEHPKRPVLGMQCPRGEVSGQRLWGWARERFGTPEKFFARFFVLNYCPLCFMERSGRNFTPDKLPPAERAALFAVCDRALRAAVETLHARYVIGIGRFAEQRIVSAVAGLNVITGHVPHPSPASPQANRGWAAQMDGALRDLGIHTPSTG